MNSESSASQKDREEEIRQGALAAGVKSQPFQQQIENEFPLLLIFFFQALHPICTLQVVFLYGEQEIAMLEAEEDKTPSV